MKKLICHTDIGKIFKQLINPSIHRPEMAHSDDSDNRYEGIQINMATSGCKCWRWFKQTSPGLSACNLFQSEVVFVLVRIIF